MVLLGHTGINLGSGMTGGLAYILDGRNDDLSSEPAWNAEFVCAEECTTEEDAMLRQVLRRHHELTDSPTAAVLLERISPLPMKRLQPRQLSCTVAQTWEPILRRLGMSAVPAPHSSFPVEGATSNWQPGNWQIAANSN